MIMKVKLDLASSSLRSPNFLAITALDPLDNINPNPITIFIKGYIILKLESASVFINLDIKTPSTILYKAININIVIEGTVNFINFVNLKSLEISLIINPPPF